MFSAILEDARMARRRRPQASARTVLAAWLTSRGFRIALNHRMAHAIHLRGWRLAAGILHRLGCRLGADIHPAATIGPGLHLPHPYGIVIGHGVRLGARVRVLQGVTIGGASGRKRADGSSQPSVGDDAVLGAGAKILGPVSIGGQTRIGANAVVTHDVPAHAIAAGIPARVIRLNGQPLTKPDQATVADPVIANILERLQRLETLAMSPPP